MRPAPHAVISLLQDAVQTRQASRPLKQSTLGSAARVLQQSTGGEVGALDQNPLSAARRHLPLRNKAEPPAPPEDDCAESNIREETSSAPSNNGAMGDGAEALSAEDMVILQGADVRAVFEAGKATWSQVPS